MMKTACLCSRICKVVILNLEIAILNSKVVILNLILGFVLHKNSQKKTFATIEDWLYLIDHAEYVITNSFHCCVFSLLFKKKFAVVPLTGKVTEMNSRLETLFKIFKIPSRWLKNKDDFSVLELSLEPSLTANTNFNILEI